MSDVLEEMTGEKLDRAQVEARIDDWEHRVIELFAQVGTWLPDGWTAEVNRYTRMFEEPMREAQVPERKLPILDLFKNGVCAATIEPRGFWIIGANGRLDFRSNELHHLIIDEAKNFEPPQWNIVSMTDRSHSEPFNQSVLQSVL